MVRQHSQEQILRVVEARVAVNDGVNDPIVLLAEASWLYEHLFKVPGSVFAWRMDFYGEPYRIMHE